MIPSSASLEVHEEAIRIEEAQFKEQKRIEQWLENRLSQFNGGAASPLLASVTAAQAPAVGFREDGR